MGALCGRSCVLLGRDKQEQDSGLWFVVFLFLFLILQWCYLWTSQPIVKTHKAGRYFKRCGMFRALSQNDLI